VSPDIWATLLHKSKLEMNKIKIILIIATLFLVDTMIAQQLTQTIKGTILDADSEMPLGTSTDLDGRYRIDGVPVGRQTIRVSYLGYNSVTLPNVVINSGKESITDIMLTENVNTLDEIVITAEVEKDRSVNEMTTISAKTFSLEEVTRYSGGRNDASRLVSNYAGVATADDSRNDIVIRGNSPAGILWRLEGVPMNMEMHYRVSSTWVFDQETKINLNLQHNWQHLADSS